jgi:hypothetical protein
VVAELRAVPTHAGALVPVIGMNQPSDPLGVNEWQERSMEAI